MLIYPPNPACMRHKGKTAHYMGYEATLPPSGALPARVVFRCITDSTHTQILPLLCSWEEYSKYKEASQRGPLHRGKFIPKILARVVEVVEIWSPTTVTV